MDLFRRVLACLHSELGPLLLFRYLFGSIFNLIYFSSRFDKEITHKNISIKTRKKIVRNKSIVLNGL